MQAEFDGLVKNHTWVLVSLPKDRKVIKNKWVWRVKKLASSLVDKLKSKVWLMDSIKQMGLILMKHLVQ